MEIPATTAQSSLLVCGRILTALLVLGSSGCSGEREPEFLTSVPWSFSDQYLVVDTHTHTKFSDGKLAPVELLALANDHHCDAIAITDHSDSSKTASPEYFNAIDAARERYPRLIVFAGMEWNVPPYGGREHVVVLGDPRLERNLDAFRREFEDGQADAGPGFTQLQKLRTDAHDVIALYAHPSRKDASVGENRDDYLAWSRAGEVLIGFEGAPGHQHARNLGSYRGAVQPVDGWDPVAAEIGGVWDQLLDEGISVWAAAAPSDFHSHALDFAPCAFSRTHVQVGERSHAGVLAALRAGSFWADHGGLLDTLTVRASAENLLVPASPGESFSLGKAGSVTVSVDLERGPGARDQALIVELIGNGLNGTPQLLESRRFDGAPVRLETRFPALTPGADGVSVYFRVRVRLERVEGRDLAAYSNPIRVYLAPPRG